MLTPQIFSAMLNNLRRLITDIILFAPIISLVSCDNNSKYGSNGAPETAFFGDSTLTIISTNKPNGYDIKIFKSDDIMLMNLRRGDTINQYVPITYFPNIVGEQEIPDDMIGTIYRKIDIPIEKEKLGSGIFFMDVNFDGEEDLVIEHHGYNRQYFACFDLLNGKTSVAPGFLTPLDNPPYNNIVGPSPVHEGDAIATEFDYKKKTIHIFEQIGCCSYIETLAEYGQDEEWEQPSVRVIREKRGNYTVDRVLVTEIYERKDGELKLISVEKE